MYWINLNSIGIYRAVNMINIWHPNIWKFQKITPARKKVYQLYDLSLFFALKLIIYVLLVLLLVLPLRRPYIAKKAFCSAYVSAMYFIVVLLLYVLVLLFAWRRSRKKANKCVTWPFALVFYWWINNSLLNLEECART